MTTYPTGIDQAMLKGIDACLGVRDAVGAVIEPVFFLTRTWYSDVGKTTPATAPEGYATDSAPVQLFPSPGMKDFSQDVRLREGGVVKAGDIILTGVSKNKYQQSDLDGSVSAPNIQKFYLIGVKLYQVINVTEKHVTFNVQVRELTNQTRY
jgi:hypothetical protein